MKNNEVTLVTTVKDRWLYLKEALNTWVGKRFYDIIIVNWGTKEVDLFEKIKEKYNNIKVIEVIGDITKNYLGSIARNISIEFIRSNYIFFIDCDVKIIVDEIDEIISEGRDFYHGHISTTGAHTTGSCIVSKKMIEEVNGYNEDLGVLPIEDRDLYRRLKMIGYKEGYFKQGSVIHIDHSYEDRIRYRQWRRDLVILYDKWGRHRERKKVFYNLRMT